MNVAPLLQTNKQTSFYEYFGFLFNSEAITAGWWWIYLSGELEKIIPAGLSTFLGRYGYR